MIGLLFRALAISPCSGLLGWLFFCALVPRAFFLDLSLASPNVRWGLSRPITSENGLLGQAEDFNLLGHPAEQRGEFYRLKFVGWCAGWLRRVRRVTLLALHQLTCRRLGNERSQSDPKMIPNTIPKISELKC